MAEDENSESVEEVKKNEKTYRTKLSCAKSKSENYMRTTVPKQLAEQFRLQMGDKLMWVVSEDTGGGISVRIEFQKG